MESRNMVLMTLSSGKEWRPRCRKQTCRHSGERGPQNWSDFWGRWHSGRLHSNLWLEPRVFHCTSVKSKALAHLSELLESGPCSLVWNLIQELIPPYLCCSSLNRPSSLSSNFAVSQAFTSSFHLDCLVLSDISYGHNVNDISSVFSPHLV